MRISDNRGQTNQLKQAVSVDSSHAYIHPKQDDTLNMKFSYNQEVGNHLDKTITVDLKSPINASFERLPINASFERLKGKVMGSLKTYLNEEMFDKIWNAIVEADRHIANINVSISGITSIKEAMREIFDEALKNFNKMNESDVNILVEHRKISAHQLEDKKFKNLITISDSFAEDNVKLIAHGAGHEMGHIFLRQSEIFKKLFEEFKAKYESGDITRETYNKFRQLDEAFSDIIGAIVHSTFTSDRPKKFFAEGTSSKEVKETYEKTKNEERFTLNHPRPKTREAYINNFLNSLDLNINRNKHKYERLLIQIEESFKIESQRYEKHKLHTILPEDKIKELQKASNDNLEHIKESFKEPLKELYKIALYNQFRYENQIDLGTRLEVSSNNRDAFVKLIDFAIDEGLDTHIFIHIFNLSQIGSLTNDWSENHNGDKPPWV